MKRLGLAIGIAMLPFAAQAADLSTEYAFIQDNAPPSAASSVIGHLELSAGWQDYDADVPINLNDLGVFEGWGRVNVPFAGNWNLELETGGGALWKNGNSASHIGAYAHLWSGWNGVRVGGFGGVDFITSSEFGIAGIEAEVDVGNLTLGAQGSYSTFLDCSGICPEAWGARVWADLYIAANTRLGIEGRYWDISGLPPLPPGANNDIWGVSGTAEHRFAGSPLSVFVRGDYEKTFDAIETVTVSGGIRVLIDDGLTLEGHDRGVPFDVRHPVVLLPGVIPREEPKT